jgi:DNA-binding response OmpR family regulator
MKILAIDDDLDFLKMLALRVISLGHRIKTTDSPTEFLKELTRIRYDVALVDFFIPIVGDAGLLLSEVFAPYANGTQVYILTDADRDIVEKSMSHAVVRIRGILEKTNLSETLNGVLCGI